MTDSQTPNTPENLAAVEVLAPLEVPPEAWPRSIIHYTTAQGLHAILSTKTLLLSAASLMTDVDEVHGSFEILSRKYATSEKHREWRETLLRTWPEFIPTFTQYFNSLVAQAIDHVYMSCWCEADPAHPEGKLSMWRAYGADGRGNAIAVSTAPLLENRMTTEVPLRFFKTRYEDEEAFCKTLQACADAILKHLDTAKRIAAQFGIEEVCWLLTHAWFVAAATRKHPGFSEENEWRFLYVSSLDPRAVFRSGLGVDAVGSQLRPRLHLPLRDYADLGSPGTALSDILQYVVIGPNTPDKKSARIAAELLLNAAGVPKPNEKVRTCSTPYRSFS